MARVGKYELVRKLATGGMAEVFLARFEWAGGLEKTVVVKRILPHLAEDPVFREMFFSEAQLAAQLNHPGIAQIIEFGESEGTYFLAMEYVDGPSLRALEKAARAREEHIPFAHSARIAAYCCEALAHAHDLVDSATGQPLNLVHRDISPDNILIARNGTVKLVDFGIAKATTQSHRTQTGLVKGKLAYMSPEQVRSEALDRRTDIYALGVVLYEMIAGARPYDATSDLTLLDSMLREDIVPLRKRRPDVPEALERIVTRALQRRRDDRYPDCRAMHAGLEEALIAIHQPASAFHIAQLVARYDEPPQRADPGPTPALATPEKPIDTARTPGPRVGKATDAGRDAAQLAEPVARTGTDDNTIRQPFPQPPERPPAPRAAPAPVERVAADGPTLPRAAMPVKPGPPVDAGAAPPVRRAVPRPVAIGLIAASVIAAFTAILALRPGPTASGARRESARVTQPSPPAPVSPVAWSAPMTPPAPPAPAVEAPAATPPPTETGAASTPAHGPPTSVGEVAPPSPPPPSRAPARTAALAPVVELELRSDPPARLKVLAGHKVIAQGRSPLAAKVPPGTVIVEASGAGENTFEKRETLTLGVTPRQVSHTIMVMKGNVSIRTFPSAHVSVDGVPRGDVPLKLDLYEGPHVVRLECDRSIPLCAGGLVVTKSIVVEPGKTVDVMHKWQ